MPTPTFAGPHSMTSHASSSRRRAVIQGQPPVLIFGSGMTSLGVMRALGRRGIESLATGSAHDGAHWSRWHRPAPWRAPAPGSTTALAEFLHGLELESAVLIPCSDHWAETLSALDPELLDRFRTSLPTADVIATLVDKGGLAAALRNAEVPHPETRLLESEASLRDVPDPLLRSSFLKPVDSQRFGPLFGAKALSISSLDDALIKFRRTQDAGIAMLLQEYVPGPPDNHYFVDGFMDAGGVVRALFARRRYRMYPSDFGNSSYMASVAVSEVEQGATDLVRLLHSTRYRGIFSAEFKRDVRDGVLKLLEVNVRPWWYVEFAARCGVDVCHMYYEDALGRPVETISRYAEGQRLVHTWSDYRAWRSRNVAGGHTWWRHWSAWIGSHRPTFAWDDPMPAVANSARAVTRLMIRPFRRKD